MKTYNTKGVETQNVVPAHFALALLPLLAYGTLQFSLTFPFILWYEGATKYYMKASYHYDEINTFFDNTIWTYGTDYGIGVVMLIGAIHCWKCVQGYPNLRFLSSGLLICYFLSVLFGGYAHQTYMTLDSLNTTSFRIVWTICVGTVTLAGGFIGAIGTELGTSLNGMEKRLKIPLLPQYFWALWGIYLTTVCAMGGISFKRPACDIFIAGTTQSFPTFYTVLIVLNYYWSRSYPSKNPSLFKFVSEIQHRSSNTHRLFFALAFLLNAPLLPAYPVLLSTGFSLGTVNAILHSNLLAAWGLQYWSLWKFCVALDDSSTSAVATKLS